MKYLINLLKRAGLVIQIRCLEITVDGQTECLECVRDPSLQLKIIIARQQTRRELNRLRAQYSALLPVGVVRVWKEA